MGSGDWLLGKVCVARPWVKSYARPGLYARQTHAVTRPHVFKGFLLRSLKRRSTLNVNQWTSCLGLAALALRGGRWSSCLGSPARAFLLRKAPHLVQCWGALLHHVTSYLLDFPWCVIVSDKVTTSSCRPANVTLALGDLAKSQDT